MNNRAGRISTSAQLLPLPSVEMVSSPAWWNALLHPWASAKRNSMKKTRFCQLLAFGSILTLSLMASASSRHAAQLSLLPQGAQSSISAVLGRDLPEYHMQPVSGGFSALNAHQKLQARFTVEGVELRNRGAGWGMTLSGWGYGDAMVKLEADAPQAIKNRVEYRRGPLTEWYVNGPLGLEQGFTLSEPPGRSHGQPLTLALKLSGDLSAAVDPSKTGLRLTNRQKQVQLRYAGLRAYDAAGKQLHASLELSGEQLLLKLSDADARYPVVIDPVVQAAELTASQGEAGDQLGISVAINGAGNTVVVGAPNATPGTALQAGAAYVFVEAGSGWANATQTATLSASDGAVGDNFGSSVSIAGNTIVVGAPSATIGSNEQQGAAYVFVEPQGGWSNMNQTGKLTASDGNIGDGLGSALALSGNTIVAGVPLGTVGSNYAQGAAYVFVQPPTGWATMTQTSKLATVSGTTWDSFGTSVAISGNTVVVGTPYAQINTNQCRGAGYVFVAPPTGWPATMTPTARLLASDGVSGDEFGFVAIGGGNKTIVVGAPWANANIDFKGAAYLYVEPTNGWANMTQTAKLTPSDGAKPDYFGNAVAVSADGGTVVVGSPNSVIGTNVSQGAVYVFVEPTGGWVNMNETAKVTASDGAAGAMFGTSVGVNNNAIAIGAPDALIGTNLDQGAAYVFSVQ